MKSLPARQRFVSKLSRIKDEPIAHLIVLDAEERYNKLLTSSQPHLKNQKRMILQRVLPLLSIYQSMKSQSIDQQEALLIIEILLKETFFSTQLSGIRFLNQILVDPFPVIKPALRLMIHFSDLPAGQEIKQDDKNCFAINVKQCFLNDFLKKVEAPELTPVFCATDDWLSEAMPKIQWQRTQTLGRGGEMCDFCWCRKTHH